MFTLLTLFACYWQDKYCDFYKATTMLTKKGKYGLKALVDLARLAPGETAFINDIAARNNIPKKFLDTILLELRNVGILRSKKGPGGGYSLSRLSLRNPHRPCHPHARRAVGADPLRQPYGLRGLRRLCRSRDLSGAALDDRCS